MFALFCETPLARWSIRPLCEKNSLFKGGSSGSRISSQLGEHNDLWELKEVLKDDEVHSFSSNPLILLIAPDEGGDVLRSSSLGDMKIEMDEGEGEDDNDDTWLMWASAAHGMNESLSLVIYIITIYLSVLNING